MTTRLEKLPTVAPIWIVAFSGHRPGDAAGRSAREIEACRASLRAVFTELAQKARTAGGTIEILCGPAEGADQLALSLARELELAVHLMLPMNEASLHEDFAGSPPEAWSAVTSALEHARDPHTKWTVRVAGGDSERPGCYHDANLQMLELADVLVALHSSRDVGKLGGTGELLAIAERAGLALPVITLDSARGGQRSHSDEWDPAGAPAAWLATLNADMASEAARASAPTEQRGGADPVWDVHRALDNVANNSARRFRGSLEQSIYLHFAATVLAAITAALTAALARPDQATLPAALELLPKAFTGVELLLVVLATSTMWRANRARANSVWRRTRVGAELVDGQVLSAGLLDPLRPPIARHDGRWKLFAVSVSLAAHRQRDARLARLAVADPLKERRDEYVRERIDVQRQQYFRDRRKVSHSWHRRLTALSQYASVAAVFVIGAALAVKLLLPGDVSHSALVEPALLFLPIFLPLLASLASSLTIAKDAARRSSRYESVLARLDRFSGLIGEARTTASLERLVGEVEGLLLDELIEWHGTAGSMGH